MGLIEVFSKVQLAILTEWITELSARAEHKDRSLSEWFYSRTLDAYLRCGPRYVNGEIKWLITVSNIIVRKPLRGTFSQLLELIEGLVLASDRYRGIYVESVINAELAASGAFERRGFQRCGTTNEDVNFIKLLR